MLGQYWRGTGVVCTLHHHHTVVHRLLLALGAPLLCQPPALLFHMQTAYVVL